MFCCYLGWVNIAWRQKIYLDSQDTICWIPVLPKACHSFTHLSTTCLTCSGRRSLHQFDNPEEETLPLIYNYTPVYAANFTGYEQVYFFWVSHRYISPQRCSLPPTVLRIKDHFHQAAEKCFANTCHVWNKCAHLCKYSDIFLIFLGMNAFKFPTDCPLLWQC